MIQTNKAGHPGFLLGCLFACFASGQSMKLDERPKVPGEWGYRPAHGAIIRTTPPAFSWRPQKGLQWSLQVSRSKTFDALAYQRDGIQWNVHCPAIALSPGTYAWRYRGLGIPGKKAQPPMKATNWSRTRTFTIARDAVSLSLPEKEDLLARIPEGHPRLFLRPEDLPRLRALAKGSRKAQYDALVKSAEKLLRSPPATEEPPTYPAGMVRGSDGWRKMWWGNRNRVIAVLNGAATLGFTWLLSGRDAFGQQARTLLMACAAWNPKGSTGYRYNDEAGMPYNYYFARTYSFINSLLTDEEKAICRRVMTIRGDEMYRHLCPSHFWRPYGSHRNRAWHFLGEMGIAFHREIPQAADWTWFGANVFFNTYPVWCDDDGGWHEGASYWSSYQHRFTWWADVMRAALKIDAYRKPYYSQAGYYAMYLMPPGKKGGGFGDLTASRTSRHFRSIMTTLAAQSGNGHWQWWVQKNGGPSPQDGYVGFVRGLLPEVQPAPPVGLPSSRVFRGTGQAFLNSNLENALDGVQVAFKSSPFGTQSHGYEANNAFLIAGYGRRLLIRSGYRDHYGSAHHRNWMWDTRSVNNIKVNGLGQKKRHSDALGAIVSFKTTPAVDMVSGEAGAGYEYAPSSGKKGSPLHHYNRTILFAKPDLVVIFDRLHAKEKATFEFMLHGLKKFQVLDAQHVVQANQGVFCGIDFVHPAGLAFQQTDQYDPNPRPRIKLREWHLTATAPGKRERIQFITVYRIKQGAPPKAPPVDLKETDAAYQLHTVFSKGTLQLELPKAVNDAVRWQFTPTHP